mmetsp:Transcript_22932/g.62212  ORF Transcript_22932/g.62212 Transcript_22932/m.62212 type:complete len:486 (-) Transcript_22932:1866-3323(-)
MRSAHRPVIAIAGGGPAGLLTALLLARQPELDVRVYERAQEPESWSAQSYTISLNEKGQRALAEAGALDAVRSVGLERKHAVMHMAGSPDPILRDRPGVSTSRPGLVACLRALVVAEGRAHLCDGAAVADVVAHAPPRDLPGLMLVLEDGSQVLCSHVVGCDGKWSRVRASAATLAAARGEPVWQPQLVDEGSWGVLFEMGAAAPAGLAPDAIHLFLPANTQGHCYGIASSLPDHRGPQSHGSSRPGAVDAGGASAPPAGPHPASWHATLVIFDSAAQRWPGLEPRDDAGGDAGHGSWNADAGEATESAGRAAIDALLADELPDFAAAVSGARAVVVRRRASWVRLGGPPTLAALGGRVALVGDAGHSMTPSMGEGCNTALESAACLAGAVARALTAWREGRPASSSAQAVGDGPGADCGGGRGHADQAVPSVHGNDESRHSTRRPNDLRLLDEALSAAFAEYGESRSPIVANVQAKSAAASTRR